MPATTTTSPRRQYRTSQRIRDLAQAGELRARIPELIEQMGLKRPSRQAVDSALKVHYDRPGRPFSALTDVGLIHEIYDAFREGVATATGLRLTKRLETAIIVAELRVGQNEAHRAKKARKRAEERNGDVAAGLKTNRGGAAHKGPNKGRRKADRRRSGSGAGTPQSEV